MKTNAEIVEILARDRRVEKIIERVAGHDTRTADLADLSQMVYLTLLELPDGLLQDLFENGQENHYIVRVIKNQYFQDRQWYRLIRKFAHITTELPKGL